MNLDQQITQALDTSRPDRYRNMEWVADAVRNITINEEDQQEVIREYIERRARQHEGQNTKLGNRLFREFYTTNQLPIGWEQIKHLPISLTNEQLVDGEVKTVNERVKLQAASAKDIDLWALGERRAADRDHAKRLEAVRGAEMIAASMRDAGALRFADWAITFSVADEAA